MDDTNFRDRVRRAAAPKIEPPALEQALDEYLSENPKSSYHASDVGEVYRRAGLLARELRPARRPLFAPSPWSRLTSQALLASIDPWVSEVRSAIVAASGGKVQLPFPSKAAAVEWIEREGGLRGLPPDFDEDRYDRLDREVLERLTEMRDMTRSEKCSYDPGEHLFLDYAKPGVKRTQVTPVDPDSPLAPLARAVPRMANATGFSNTQLTLYVLAGIEPRRAAVTLSRPHVVDNERGISRMEVRITIHSPELTFEQLRELHRQIRSAWGSEKTKPINPSDELVLEVVEELGGVPSAWGAKADFFRRVTSALKKKKEIRYKDYRSAEAAYERARQKLTRALSS